MDRRIAPDAFAALLGAPATDGPAYQWLADQVARHVSDGRLLHDTRLPGEREAASALGLSRTTVSHAYDVLRERGIAQSRRGSGTRISVPGGPVPDGREPLAGVGGGLSGIGGLGENGASAMRGELDRSSGIDTTIDLTSATPAAVPGLARYVEDALPSLGAYAASGGYYRHGIPELREALAERYTRRGLPTSPDEILVTTGALAGIAATVQALLRPGDRVASESTGYPNSLATLRGRGARLVPVPDDGEHPDVGVLDRLAARSDLKAMLLMPDFHNPTGRYLDDEQRYAIGSVWRRRGVLGIVDETSVDLWWDSDPAALPMGAYAGDCVSVGSASKTYWGGLRLGWVRAPRRYIAPISAARLTLDLGAPVLEQLVLARLLRETPGLDDARRTELRANRDRLAAAVAERCDGWECDIPAGGLSLWWRLPKPVSSALVAEAVMQGLALSPGAAFSLDGRGLEARLRTPFTLPADDLNEAIARLGAAWDRVA